MVEAIPAGNMKRHPASEEEERCHTRNNEKVKVLGKIEETEMDTGILGVITGGKLTFGLRKVEGASVCLSGTCYHEYHEGDDSGDVARENEPEMVLSLHDATYRHCAGHDYHGNDAQTHRKLIADHLGT